MRRLEVRNDPRGVLRDDVCGGCCCSVNSSSETEPANIETKQSLPRAWARLAQNAEKIKTGGALVVAPISWQRRGDRYRLVRPRAPV